MAKKNPNAVALGRRGGQRRVQKGFGVLPDSERAEAARRGVQARWDAYYAAHPEKLKAKQEREARRGTVARGRPPKKKAKAGK